MNEKEIIVNEDLLADDELEAVAGGSGDSGLKNYDRCPYCGGTNFKKELVEMREPGRVWYEEFYVCETFFCRHKFK